VTSYELAQLNDAALEPGEHPLGMKSLRCACGTCIEAETGRQLLEAVEAHVLAAHASPLEDATASPVVPEAAEQPISDAVDFR
jgi:hypothetical protein